MGILNLKISFLKILLALALFVGLYGCRDNPIIGEWTIVDNRQAKSGLICRNMEFSDKREICDGLVIGVKYEFTDGGVIISQSAENAFFNIGVKINVLSKDMISYVDPFSGKVIYYQRKGTTAISSTVATLLKTYTKKELQESCEGGVSGSNANFSSQAQAQQAVDAVCLAAKLK